MFTTEFITDVFREELAREADYRNINFTYNLEEVYKVTEKIQKSLDKFEVKAGWSYEEQEQVYAERLVTLLDRAVNGFINLKVLLSN